MSDSRAPAVMGLGDSNIDPEILTKDVDHDFFDHEPTMMTGTELDVRTLNGGIVNNGGSADIEIFKEAQRQLGIADDVPNKNEKGVEGDNELKRRDVSKQGEGVRLVEGKQYADDDVTNGLPLNGNDARGDCEGGSGCSSNCTVNLELGKDGVSDLTDFYALESNATSPNYPRPKQCYQLQQRRKSVGSIQRGLHADNTLPMNHSDCGLIGRLDEMSSSSSSSSSSSDDGLSDSSESELETLNTDDEEFVDMLEKYFDYIEQESDCSDLTEVSPLSSVAASPLPSSVFSDLLDFEDHEDFELETESLCSAADGLQIQQEGLLQPSAPLANGFQGAAILSGLKPSLPLIISTTETVTITSGEEVPDALPMEKLKDFEGKAVDEGVASGEVSPSGKDAGFMVQVAEEGDRSVSCCSGNSNVSIIPGDSSRSSSSVAWSGSKNGGGGGGRKGRVVSSSGSSSSSSLGVGGKRPPKNYTFTSEQMRKIDRENHILLRKIIDTHRGHSHARGCHRNGHNRTTTTSSSASVNRIRQQKRIEHENMILMKRLQSAKPSKEIGDAFKEPKPL